MNRLNHKHFGTMLRLFLISVFPVISGCNTTVPYPSLTTEERLEIKERNKSIVLLRIVFEHPDGRHVLAFPTSDQYVFKESFFRSISHLGVDIGHGDFNTGFRIFHEAHNGYLSEETRNQGWTYLLLEPEMHHLSFTVLVYGNWFPDSTREQLDNVPHWYIDIPPETQLIYAGTLVLYCFNEADKYQIHKERTILKNEESLAQSICEEPFEEFLPLKTILLKQQEQGIPIITKTPWRYLKADVSGSGEHPGESH